MSVRVTILRCGVVRYLLPFLVALELAVDDDYYC